MTIIGEAGIGKTRLASELTAGLAEEPDPPRVLVGRNPPYGRGIAFWALGEILRDAAGTAEEAPVSEVEAALAALLGDLGADDAEEIAASLMLALRGSEDDREAGAEEGLRRSWRRFVGLLAAERPLVIGIDDAHWADDGLLDLLEEAVFGLADAPLLLLCTSRPELMERRPDFGRAVGNVSQVELRPLDPGGGDGAGRAAAPGGIDGRWRADVAQVSGGNPFFAEEVSCAAARRAAATGVGDLPDTVQATIAGRIDLLPADEKRVLQEAAVLGHTFSRAPRSLLGSRPRASWRSSPQGPGDRAGGQGPGHFAFRHQLIRDVAYSSLPRAERARLARADRGRHPRSRGRPLRRAGGASRLSPRRGRRLAESEQRAERAHGRCVEAADFAVRRGAGGRGRELYEQAAGARPETRPSRRGDPEDGRRDRPAAMGRRPRRCGSAEERGDSARKPATRRGQRPSTRGWSRSATRMGGISGRIPEEESGSVQAKARALADPEDRIISPAAPQRRLDRLGLRTRGGDGRAGPRGSGDGPARPATRR